MKLINGYLVGNIANKDTSADYSCPECLGEGYIEVGFLDDIHLVKCQCRKDLEINGKVDALREEKLI